MATSDVTGKWVSVPPFPMNWTVNMTLTQTGSNISGNGTIKGPNPNDPVTPFTIIPPSTNNTPNQPNVSVTISVTGLGSIVLTANFTDNTFNKLCGALGQFGSGCIQRASQMESDPGDPEPVKF